MAAWAPGDTRLGGGGLQQFQRSSMKQQIGLLKDFMARCWYEVSTASLAGPSSPGRCDAKVQIDKRVLIQAALLQMFANTGCKSPSHAWRGFKNPVLCKSNWLTCRERKRGSERGRKRERERERCGKWKDRVHLLPEEMGERFTDLWHTHCWSMQREPLCPWKIATWPLFQLCLPLCNCHGCSLNTHTRTHAHQLWIYTANHWGQRADSPETRPKREQKRGRGREFTHGIL